MLWHLPHLQISSFDVHLSFSCVVFCHCPLFSVTFRREAAGNFHVFQTASNGQSHDQAAAEDGYLKRFQLACCNLGPDAPPPKCCDVSMTRREGCRGTWFECDTCERKAREVSKHEILLNVAVLVWGCERKDQLMTYDMSWVSSSCAIIQETAISVLGCARDGRLWMDES